MVEYQDWSDRNSDNFNNTKFGEFSCWNDDGTICLNIRRNTKTKKDFSILLTKKEIEEIIKIYVETEEG